MWARHGLRRLSAAAAPCRYASTLVIGEHAAGALAAGTYHAIGAASQLGGEVSGEIVVSLGWAADVDLDLHVYTPDGSHITGTLRAAGQRLCRSGSFCTACDTIRRCAAASRRT